MKISNRTRATDPRLTVAPAGARELPAGREIELKFLVDEGDFKASQNWPALANGHRRKQSQRLRTVYFDTDARDLGRRRMFLRVRQLRNRYTMALKWSGNFSGGHFERGEIEVAMRLPEPDPALLGEPVVAEIMRVTEGKQLQPVFATDIRRVTCRVPVKASEIEVGFDTGFIVAGEQRSVVREIELELKSGDPVDLYQFGLALVDSFPVRLGVMNKSERGLLLSTGDRPTAVRAEPPLATGQTVDEAIGAMIASCIDQFIANWPAFESGEGPEPVHQMRIAMRRLRSVLGLLHREFPCADFLAFRDQARQIGSAMNEARNWDVFADLVANGPREAFKDEAGFEALLAASSRWRDIGYDTVRAALADRAVTRFVLSVQAFIARRGWRNGLAGTELPSLTAHASQFAARNLGRLHHRARRRGKGLVALPPAERHAVRIELKKLRYAVDAFANLFADRVAVRSYARATARLQEALGKANDMNMAIDLARQLEVAEHPGAARAIGILMGWYGHGAISDGSALRRTWKEFRRAGLFWSSAAAEPARG